MNPIAEEINELMHYGMPKRSGRYPWGSGEDPYQHGTDFLARVEDLRKQGFKYTDDKGKTYTGDTAIAKSMGLSTTQFRTELSLAKDERRALSVAKAKSLKADGLGDTEIGRRMGVNESTVRSWLNADSEARMNQAKETANFIKDQIEKKGMIDVGRGVERELNISKEKLDQALYLLERDGYPLYQGRFEQQTNKGQWTTQRVICPKGTEHKEIYELDKIHPLNEDNYISRDGGETFEKKFHYPASMDSKRLQICYKEDGGIEKDGIVELRRGVDDLSLGESRYSQVRILVDGSHYIKGMAVYSDDLPPGVDVRFNTNKSKEVPMQDVLKKIKSDPDNPFGSAIKDVEQGGQYWYTDKATGERKLGLINKRADEGDWSDWKDALPSQFLSKQSLDMAKKQLGLAKDDKLAEYNELCSITNPTIKKHLLQKFSDECDSAAVHLQAAALPGQKYHVIIPVNSLKENEIYAPGYHTGTKLALIRYPHGGTFEIPILTVNNDHQAAKNLLGTDIMDAVAINSKVASRLSGADFDGDTVMCIPTHDSKGRVKVTSTVGKYKELDDLKDFDPKVYKYDKVEVDADGNEHYYRNGVEFRKMKNTGTEMGKISNLITDMTLLGADEKELARAVRHSMVVIDAEKHGLDYKQSELDNNIAALRKDYQVHVDKSGNVRYGGASTIVSRAKGQESVIKRQGTPKVNMKGKEWYDPTKPEGAYIYKDADDASYEVSRTNKRTGEVTTITRYRMQRSTKMAEADDAYSLVSDARHPMEIVYADYANSMKALANQARKEMMSTGKIEYSRSAKEVYRVEVASLNTKLKEALLNTPRERAAQRMTTAEVQAKKAANPDMKTSDVKKAGQQALTKYRQEVNSIARKNRNIEINDREWEAIQAGAVSENILKQILDNADVDKLRQRATPKATSTLSAAKMNKIKQMKANDYSLAEIAQACGCSTSTVSNYLKGSE